MKVPTLIILSWFVLVSKCPFAQSPKSERLDSTISIFWNPNIKIRVQILDPDEPDIRKKNTVLTQYSLEGDSRRILFRDSIFAYTLRFKQMDFNGDGIKDLLVYYVNNGQENLSYHLFIVDQERGRLTRVKGFEKVFNPYYDHDRCKILGFESLEKKLILRIYQIDKKGTLSWTTLQ